MLGDDKEVYNKDLDPALLAQMEGPQPPDDFASNGCTASPDQIGSADLRPACHFHDFAYGRWQIDAVGGTENDRMEADSALYRNLRRCGLARRHAWYYFAAVHFCGYRCFTYRPGAAPRCGWTYLLERLLTLFVRIQW